MAKTYHESAPAKINLSLRVTGRDSATGYHLLDMVNARISLIDKIQMTVGAAEDGFQVDGQYVVGTNGESLAVAMDNIVWKAINAFREQYDVSDPIALTLTKQIPVGAGLGGGSSDAAAVLRVLCRHYFQGQYPVEIFDIALKLGADVPYFLADYPWQRVTGIGENLEELSESHPALQLRDQFVTLIIPPFSVDTKTSFAKFKERSIPFAEPSSQWEVGVNDLLQASFAAQPLLEDFYTHLKQTFPLKSFFMSGSGSTLFALDVEQGELAELIPTVTILKGKVLLLRFL